MKTPPQLPPPCKKTGKDAAQAVKRVDSLTLQAVTSETLRDLGSTQISGERNAAYPP